MVSFFGFVLFFDKLFFRIHFKHFDYDACKFGATIPLLSMFIWTFQSFKNLNFDRFRF